MKKIANIILTLPSWCVVVVLMYGILFAEFTDTLNQYVYVDATVLHLFQTITRIGYFVGIAVSVITWMVMSLMFHLMALLFDGHGRFWRFAIGSSFPYVIPSVIILAALFMLNDHQIIPAANAASILEKNPVITSVAKIINLSFILYYLAVMVLARYYYNVKWLYALASVAMPAAAVWGIAEVIKTL